MLTSYTGCWGSFMLRGWSLALFGALLTASPGMPIGVLLPLLSAVLLAAGANAASVGLRLRPLSGGWWLLVLEGALSVGVALAALLRPGASAVMLLMPLAALAAIGGLYQLWSILRRGHAVQSVWPAAIAGGLSVGYALLLATQPLVVVSGNALPIGLASAALGLAFFVAGLRFRKAGRAARHEILRDAPLACRPDAGRRGAPRPVPLSATQAFTQPT